LRPVVVDRGSGGGGGGAILAIRFIFWVAYEREELTLIRASLSPTTGATPRRNPSGSITYFPLLGVPEFEASLFVNTIHRLF